VRDARRLAGPLRERLSTTTRSHRPAQAGKPALTASKVMVRYAEVVAVRSVDLTLAKGEIVALMGRNGSGKSSLLWALQGAGPRAGGRVDVSGTDPQRLSKREARRAIGLVPQTASDLLYLETVDAECVAADRESEAAAGTCRALLDRFVPGIDGSVHPRDLSEGQKLALVLAIQLVAAPNVLLLDEPTRGLDYPAKRQLGEVLAELAAEGKAIVVATHDVEFAAQVARRVLVMAEGELVADGPVDEVLAASPAFAPQVAKVLGEGGWLTVAEVARALNGTTR
jgi:energy-coupling factor transport system ATP-binding protein